MFNISFPWEAPHSVQCTGYSRAEDVHLKPQSVSIKHCVDESSYSPGPGPGAPPLGGAGGDRALD